MELALSNEYRNTAAFTFGTNSCWTLRHVQGFLGGMNIKKTHLLYERKWLFRIRPQMVSMSTALQPPSYTIDWLMELSLFQKPWVTGSVMRYALDSTLIHNITIARSPTFWPHTHTQNTSRNHALFNPFWVLLFSPWAYQMLELMMSKWSHCFLLWPQLTRAQSATLLLLYTHCSCTQLLHFAYRWCLLAIATILL